MYSKEIKDLQDNIKQAQNNIRINRANMAQYREKKAPKHYQDSGKRNIESQKKLIVNYRERIASYREKKQKQKSMGKGIDSFKRELGKNTGKWVSNKVFGDGHSTPHRVNIKTEKQKTQSENRKDIFSKGKEFLSNENLFGDKEVILGFNKKTDNIVETPIPNDKEDIMNLVNLLLSTIKANGWKSGENEKHINSLSDACLTKLEQCEIKLISMNEINQATYVENEIKKLKKKKLIQKYMIFVGIGFLFLIGFISYQLGLWK
ncbi:hypothetical protein [Ulvibacter antarcticus]|uniref:Uncharacterized protein n=1 Tax=Ulvibacter antarcticus TaxID=442714 RepID=A0A3L9Z583_9FLAO|nr:hypothetical protein [Ulvibacter antarcticus]RMA67684.1 hypothetical protein BXY75_0037 [Ulvibacter antarcticus]